MSEPESFVARWSRLKRETASPTSADPPAPPLQSAASPPAAQQQPSAPSAGAVEPPVPQVDLSSLPPVESITAASDIRAFLQSGVPAELTKAALRRAWTADPAIRDFVGIAENQWDFTDPAAIPGFGPLEATDDVRQLVSQAMGRWGTACERVAEDPATDLPGVSGQAAPDRESAPSMGYQASGIPARIGTGVDIANASPEQNEVDAAPQQGGESAESEAAPNRRLHGSALPQ